MTPSTLKRLDVKVGYTCNNHCKFCVQGDKREKYWPKSCEQIHAILEGERAKGCRGVVFTGGEPTVHPDLLECVAYAKSIGYDAIQIQSNGRNFSREDYVRELIAAGVTEFWPSIHGFRPETHDALVGAPWAWKQVTDGMRLLARLHQIIYVNIVITQANYRELPALATLIVRLGVAQYQFAFPHILGSANKNRETVVPRKSEIMPYVKKGLDVGRRAGIICMTEAIPFCLMEGYQWAIAEAQFMTDVTVVDAEYRTESYEEYRWNEGKKKREECRTCRHDNVCEGPWREYPEMYGWDEFVPVIP